MLGTAQAVAMRTLPARSTATCGGASRYDLVQPCSRFSSRWSLEDLSQAKEAKEAKEAVVERPMVAMMVERAMVAMACLARSLKLSSQALGHVTPVEISTMLGASLAMPGHVVSLPLASSSRGV